MQIGCLIGVNKFCQRYRVNLPFTVYCLLFAVPRPTRQTRKHYEALRNTTKYYDNAQGPGRLSFYDFVIALVARQMAPHCEV